MMALVILHVLFSYQKSSEQATEITNGARLSHQSWRIFPRVVSRQIPLRTYLLFQFVRPAVVSQ